MLHDLRSLGLKAAVLAFGFSIAAAGAADVALIDKGRQLFMDPSLSASGTISCASCHPGGGHTDNKTYVGLEVVADGDPKGRSTPTLWNAGTRSVYSWAGTVPALEANIRGIIVNRMKGAEPTPEALDALAAYVRSLTPPKSGSVAADGTPKANAPAPVKRGFDLFVGAGGCGACHVPGTFDKAEPEDVGTDGKFKVPSLWAVSKSAPYFHDGRTKSLDDAVKMMWEFNGRKVGQPSTPTDAQLKDLVAYLNAL
jgi:cytochrome c peroxidase